MGVILVGMADIQVARAPDSLTTLGLGSCVGICLHDPATNIAGMAHIMLPAAGNTPGSRMKFADTGIVDLLNMMTKMGARKPTIVAKLAGGAHMFGTATPGSLLNVGERNVDACIKLLRQYNIPLKAKDTGGKHGRTIVLHAATGALNIRTVGYGESVI